MSRPPVVTYISVSFITATETPRISQTVIVLTTIVPNIILSSIVIPDASIFSHIQPVISATSNTCCTISAVTTLSTSFRTSTSPSTTSSIMYSLSPSTSSITTLTTVASSASSPFLAAAPLTAPLVSDNPTATAKAKAPSPSISLPGITGLSVALGIFFAALIGFFCYYRRKRKFHKEAMLLAPRFSKPTDQRSTRTGDKTSMNTSFIRGSLQKNINTWTAHPKVPVYENSPSIKSVATSFVRSAYMPRSSSLKSATASSVERADLGRREQEATGANNIYTVRYNPGGTLSFDHAAAAAAAVAEQRSRNVDTNSPRFNEALARLDAIHDAATIRRDLSPPPLRIVKRNDHSSSTSNQSQLPAKPPRPKPTLSSLEPISELDISNSLQDRDIEIARAAALAKLEGRGARQTVGSVYSRGEDGVPFQKLDDEDSRPVWRNMKGLWPD